MEKSPVRSDLMLIFLNGNRPLNLALLFFVDQTDRNDVQYLFKCISLVTQQVMFASRFGRDFSLQIHTTGLIKPTDRGERYMH